MLTVHAPSRMKQQASQLHKAWTKSAELQPVTCQQLAAQAARNSFSLHT